MLTLNVRHPEGGVIVGGNGAAIVKRSNTGCIVDIVGNRGESDECFMAIRL